MDTQPELKETMSTAPGTRTVVMRDPKDLAPHTLNKSVPRLKAGMPEWQALFDDVRERGIQIPIEVVGGRLVVDGETRRQVALAVGLAQVPTVDIPEDEGVTTMVEHLVLQKHLGKGQRAYLCWHLAKGLEDEKRARRVANLKKGNSPMPIESASGKHWGFEQFCEAYGFSRDLFEQARTLHLIFGGDPFTLKARNLVGIDPQALREEWEPKILDLDHPVGLGAALAGIAGAVATEGKEKAPNGAVQLDLFEAGVGAISKVAAAWPKLRRDARPEIVAAWRRVAAAWPLEFRQELAEALLQDADSDTEAEASSDDGQARRMSPEARARIAAAAKARWGRYVTSRRSEQGQEGEAV